MKHGVSNVKLNQLSLSPGESTMRQKESWLTLQESKMRLKESSFSLIISMESTDYN
jgi:hypothetical protein